MKKNKFIIISVTVLVIVILDQITKFIVSRSLSLHESLPLLKNILHFTYIHNTGAGFGIMKNMNSLLIWVSIAVIGGIVYYLDKVPEEKVPMFGFGLVLGGAFGNLIDRIFLGHVIDFIDFRIWPAFNVADSCITIGAILLIIYYWKK